MDFKDELQRRFHTDNQVLNREANQVEYEQTGEINSTVGGVVAEMQVASKEDVRNKLRENMAISLEMWKQDSKDYKNTYEELSKNTQISLKDKEKIEKFFTDKKGRSKKDRMEKITDMHKAADQLAALNYGLIALANKHEPLTIQEQISVYLTKIDIAEQERIYQYKNIKLFGDTGVIEKEKLAQNDYECRVKQNWLLETAKTIAESYVKRNKMSKKELKNFMAGILQRESLYGGKTESKAYDAYDKARKESLKEQFKKDYRKGQIVGNHLLRRPAIQKAEKPLTDGTQIVDEIFSGPEFTESQAAHLRPAQLNRLREYVRLYDKNINDEEALKNVAVSKEKRELVLSKIDLYKKILNQYSGQSGSVFRKSAKPIKDAIEKVNRKEENWKARMIADEDEMTNLSSTKNRKMIQNYADNVNEYVKDNQALIDKLKERLKEEKKLAESYGYEYVESSKTLEEIEKMEKRQTHLVQMAAYLKKYQESTNDLSGNLEKCEKVFNDIMNSTSESIKNEFKELEVDKLTAKYGEWMAALNLLALNNVTVNELKEHPEINIFYHTYMQKNFPNNEILKAKKAMLARFMKNIVETKKTLKASDNLETEPENLSKDGKTIFINYKACQANEKLKTALAGEDEETKNDARANLVRWSNARDTKIKELSPEQKAEYLREYNLYCKSEKAIAEPKDFYENFVCTTLLQHPDWARAKNHMGSAIEFLQRAELSTLLKPMKFNEDGSIPEESRAVHEDNLKIIEAWCKEDKAVLNHVYHAACNKMVQYQISEKTTRFTDEELIYRANVTAHNWHFQNIRKGDPVFEEWLKEKGVTRDVEDVIQLRNQYLTSNIPMMNARFKEAGLSQQGGINYRDGKGIYTDEDYEQIEDDIKINLEVALTPFRQNTDLKDSVKKYREDMIKETFSEKGKTRDYIDLVNEIQGNINEQKEYANIEYDKNFEKEREKWKPEDRDNKELIGLQRHDAKKKSILTWFNDNRYRDNVLGRFKLKAGDKDINRMIVQPFLKPAVKYKGVYLNQEYEENAAYNEKVMNVFRVGTRQEIKELGRKYIEELQNLPEPSEELIRSGFLDSDEFDMKYANHVLCYSNVKESGNVIPGLSDALEELKKNDMKAYQKLEDKMEFYSSSSGLRTMKLMQKKWDINKGYNKYSNEASEQGAIAGYEEVADELKEFFYPERENPLYKKMVENKVPTEKIHVAMAIMKDDEALEKFTSKEDLEAIMKLYPKLQDQGAVGRRALNLFFRKATSWNDSENEETQKQNRADFDTLLEGDAKKNKALCLRTLKELENLQFPAFTKEQLEKERNIPYDLFYKYSRMCLGVSDLMTDYKGKVVKVPGFEDAVKEYSESNKEQFEKTEKNMKIMSFFNNYILSCLKLEGVNTTLKKVKKWDNSQSAEDDKMGINLSKQGSIMAILKEQGNN